LQFQASPSKKDCKTSSQQKNPEFYGKHLSSQLWREAYNRRIEVQAGIRKKVRLQFINNQKKMVGGLA
jgi:hypothetical protein